jgi:cytochrome c oxidase subunit IV
MPANWLRVSIFVLMTLVKAFYIVGEFMHLKGEVKTLIWSIVLPLVFVIWLIIALLLEGDSILQVR